MTKRKSVSVSEFKAKALELFAEVAASGSSVEVTKRGKPIASVEPFQPPQREKNTPGQLADSIDFEQDIVAPIGPELWSATRK